MKIELCEDNGFLNDGKPTLVVLVVTNDEGKQVRIPYEATRTIQELYEDVAKIEYGAIIVPERNELTTVVIKPNDLPFIVDPPLRMNEEPKINRLKEIEREDIVKCVKRELDIDGNMNEDLELGHEYRVISIIKAQGILCYYEMLNDVKDDKIRIQCLPSEIELVRKHFIKPPRKQVFEITHKCSVCKEIVALEANGDIYEGICPKCETVIEVTRGLTNV